MSMDSLMKRIGFLLLVLAFSIGTCSAQALTRISIPWQVLACAAPGTFGSVIFSPSAGGIVCQPLDPAAFKVSGGLLTVIFPSSAVPNYSDAETPAGTINGTNATFTLVAAPSPAASLLLLRNGLVQKSGVDYTLSGSTITFASGAIPQAPTIGGVVTPDILLAYYRH